MAKIKDPDFDKRFEGAFSEVADRDALDEKLDGADERLPKPVLKEPIIKADGDAHS